MKFIDYLKKNWSYSQLVVGLDPDLNRIPKGVNIFDFCKGIVDATADYACAFKPQIAYFAAHRAETTLEKICEYIRTHYAHIPIILDSKRGDIGATAKQYAVEAFERYHAHAVTVNPYMGGDSIEPYLSWSDRGVIILCRTSNPGGSDLQFLPVDTQGQPLYLHVAKMVRERWGHTEQCGLVVGATFPKELALVRQTVGDDIPLLIPGIGAQGGDIVATVQAGKNQHKQGMLINSSRAILYASAGNDWQEAAAEVAKQTTQAIKKALN